jgi:hypothetical protein
MAATERGICAVQFGENDPALLERLRGVGEAALGRA